MMSIQMKKNRLKNPRTIIYILIFRFTFQLIFQLISKLIEKSIKNYGFSIFDFYFLNSGKILVAFFQNIASNSCDILREKFRVNFF